MENYSFGQLFLLVCDISSAEKTHTTRSRCWPEMFPRSQLRIDVSPLLSIIVRVRRNDHHFRKLTKITEEDAKREKQNSLRVDRLAQFPMVVDDVKIC